MNTVLYFMLFFTFCKCSLVSENDAFKLSVVHVNDFHARFDETAEDSSACKNDNCIGGFSRMYSAIMGIKNENPDAVILNAGDNFQGTLWYNIYKWNVTQYFMNKIPFDAIVLGNHEFDDRIDGVVPFIKALKSPVVLSNVDDSLEPKMQNIYKKSVVVERQGKKIGIIGVIVGSTDKLSSTEKLIFLDESNSVNDEAERLVKEEGVFTNIVLSHSGYERDREIAANSTGKISLIVGGHSHSLLYSKTGNVPNKETPSGPYPTKVKNRDGKEVLVVQASAFTKYVGNITLFYDNLGHVIESEGNPIYLGKNIPQDELINKELATWREYVDKIGNTVIGRSLVHLDRDNRRKSECVLGNFVTDAMVFSQMPKAKNGSWTYAAIAITNAGGLRANIPKGDITYADLVAAQPFGNTLDIGELEGRDILEMLETAAKPHYQKKAKKALNLLHFSGIRTVIDSRLPPGHRVLSVEVRCAECHIPRYYPLDLNRMYRIILPSFLSRGGNGFTVLEQKLRHLQVGDQDLDAFLDYLQHRSPVMQEIEGRIKIIEETR